MLKNIGVRSAESRVRLAFTSALVLFNVLAQNAYGSAAAEAVAAARTWRQAHSQDILREFVQLLSIPNVASDAQNIRRNAELLVSMLQRRGVNARLLSVGSAPPVVYGEIRTPNAQRTIVFYAHYDGQPVFPPDWSGGEPFTPVQRVVNGEPRIYARSASDDKAAIMAQLAALDALRSAHVIPKANVRFVWEGEEEAGSPHLGQILQANKPFVTGDVWLICDGPVDQSRRQTVVFGARGDTHLEITVYGPNRELHSGHYGNWAPNPAMMLAHLLAGMKDEDGHVLIPHFYDGVVPLSAAEKEAIAEAPNTDQVLRKELWLGRVEGDGQRLLELINLPTLNINGMASAHVGANANNIIPSSATADLDLRLVKGLDWRQQQDRVIDYVRSRGYTVVEQPPDQTMLTNNPKVAYVKRDLAGYNAVRTPMDSDIAREVVEAVESARGKVIKLPTSGGSVPLEIIERATAAPTIAVPIANHDNNQHSANENIRLQNLWDGIETMAALLTMTGSTPH